MYKSVLSLFLLLFIFTLEAQPKIGLKFSPLFSVSRVELNYASASVDTLDITNDGLKTKFSMGLILDHAFSETYKFSTGLIFVPKTVSIDFTGQNGGRYPNPEEVYNLQYLQVPFSIKLYTNEVLPDVAVFFQVGVNTEVKIYDSPDADFYRFIERFRMFDAGTLLSAGLEYQAGLNTALFFDISYQRGLLNLVKSTTPTMPLDFAIRSTSILLDFGIKF